MVDAIFAPFIDFEFMRRALIGGLSLSISAPPIGVFLMLRRMSLTGDAISHAILPGAAVGYLVSGLSVGAMTLGGLLAGALVVLLSGAISRITRSAEDSSLAAFYLISVAAGVLLMSISGSQIDLLHVLFGSILGLNDEALWLIGIVTTISLLGLATIYRPLVAECVDPDFLSTVSRMGPIAHIGFLLLVVFNLIAGFHALGTLMSVGLMILPAASSRYWCARLSSILFLASGLGFVGIFGGLLLSYYRDWPASSAIILLLGVIYAVSVAVGPSGGMLWRYWSGRHLSG